MKNISYCLGSTLIAFIIWIVVFVIFKPNCVMQTNNNNGAKKLYWCNVILYSLLLSIPIGIILLWGMKSNDSSSFNFKDDSTEHPIKFGS